MTALRPIHRSIAALLAAIAIAFIAAPSRGDEAPPAAAAPDTSRVSDPQAIAIADKVMAALGGKERWDKLVGIRWSFESAVNDTVKNSRRHSWDKYTGWHRVSGKTRAGVDFLMIHRLNTTDGKAWMGGNAIEGDSLAKLLKRANSLWINDSYWMLMPYKLRDPGVILKFAGTVRDADMIWDKLALSFDNVGDTPGDHYWVYVNRATHLVDKWEYLLQDMQPPAATYTWGGWETHDGLKFPTAKRGADGHTIYTRNIETVSAFPPTEFLQP